MVLVVDAVVDAVVVSGESTGIISNDMAMSCVYHVHLHVRVGQQPKHHYSVMWSPVGRQERMV